MNGHSYYELLFCYLMYLKTLKAGYSGMVVVTSYDKQMQVHLAIAVALNRMGY